MRYLIRFRTHLKNNAGDLPVQMMVGFIVVIVVLLYCIDFFNLALKYQNVSYSAKSITKVIECEGEVNDSAYRQMEALNANFNMDMNFTVSDVTYFDTNEKSIQFRDPFKVTVTYIATQEICSPLFSKPIVLKIPMHADVPGMSEVYWK